MTMSRHRLSPSSPRKTVRFAPLKATFLLHDDVDRKELWLSPPELNNIKAVATQEAQEWRHKTGYSSLLDDSFHNPAYNTQQRMDTFAQLDEQDNTRGLERYLSPQHFDERKSLKSQAIQGVLTYDKILKRGGSYDVDEVSEKLREISVCYSQTAKAFSRRLAMADEMAAQSPQRNLNNSNSSMEEQQQQQQVNNNDQMTQNRCMGVRLDQWHSVLA